jgi:PTS system nitrogen regulatory IIA component
MKIVDYLSVDRVQVADLQPGKKEEILSQVLEVFDFREKSLKKRVLQELVEREGVASTAVGRGMAIPHARVEGIKDILLGVVICPRGIQFDAMDKAPVEVFFVFISPKDDVKFHLRFLARLSRVLRNRNLLDRIVKSRIPEEVIQAITDFEKDHLG